AAGPWPYSVTTGPKKGGVRFAASESGFRGLVAERRRNLRAGRRSRARWRESALSAGGRAALGGDPARLPLGPGHVLKPMMSFV
ncbi:hypothetical protein ACFQ08_33910, partial [Streptosporangium algeriense]